MPTTATTATTATTVSIARPPIASLRPFVQRVWASRSTNLLAAPRERVLPTGAMHIVVRLSDAPLVLFDEPTGHVRSFSHAVVGGARSTAYVRALDAATHSIGAMLVPGAAARLFAMPATELAEAHTALDDLWGRDAVRLRDRLAECPSLEAQLALFEHELAARFAHADPIDAVVLAAVRQLDANDSIANVVARSGYSHRALIARFRDAVGLAPKTYGRVVRTQRALAWLDDPRHSLAEAAIAAGYADQAHMTRDFADIAGISPARYRAVGSVARNHVPIGATSNSFKTAASRSRE